MILEIPVSEHFALSAGNVVAEGNLRIIYPPEQSIFDQLCAWLEQCPAPTVGFNHWVFAIGATALCLRLGTYLAVLIDETKPIDSRAKRQTTSMISQDEMKRINMEASSNLANLPQLWHDNEAAYFDLLRRAYEWLPMPQKRFSDRQMRLVIRHTAESLNPFITNFPLWSNRLLRSSPWPETIAPLSSYLWYPHNWSLKKSSSQIQFTHA